MNLYSLSIQESTGISHIAQGSLVSSKSQDLIVVKASETLELYSQSQETYQLQLVLKNQTFSQIRNIMTYRPVGNLKDYLVICSDSGKLTIVEHMKDEFEKSSFRVIVQETMSKSGCRRICPGEYLAKDPKGRAIILSSTEKNKLIYLTSKSSTSDDFVISSPLEANKSNTLVLDMVGLNVGFENPLFVCLEIDYGESDDPNSPVVTGKVKKNLTLYEIDLGLNHVIKKKSNEVDPEASMILNIGENPNLDKGVLLVASQNIYYFDLKGNKTNQIRIPVRFDLLREEGLVHSDRLGQEESQAGLLFINKAFCKYKNVNFYLLQNEWGDIFKLTLKPGSQLSIDYFCTGLVSIDICIFRTGFMFMANEANEHKLFSIQKLDPLPELTQQITYKEEKVDIYYPIPFEKTEMFIEVQSLESLAGLCTLKYDDLYGDDIGQFYGITGGINGSNLWVLRHAVQTKDSIKLQLPFRPESLFTLPSLSNKKQLREFLLLSYEQKTYLLKREGENVVQHLQKLGFLLKARTIHANVLELPLKSIEEENGEMMGLGEISEQNKTKAYLQVHSGGFRVVFKNKNYMDWRCEEGRHVVRATSVENQILINLSSQELIYFLFADDELEEIARASLNNEILCMTLFVKESLRQQSTFAVLGLMDKSIRVYSLDKECCLMKMSSQFLPSIPEKIIIQNSHVLTALNNGVLCRTHIDELTGALSEARTRVMTDGQSLKLFPIKIGSKEAVVLSGNKHYLGYFDNVSGKFELQHLLIDNVKDLRFVSDFAQDQLLIVDSDKLLKISNIEISPSGFTKRKKKLDLLGRKLLINAETQNLIIIQSENRSISKSEKLELQNDIKTKFNLATNQGEHMTPNLLRFGVKPSCWQSKVSIVSPITLKEIFSLNFPANEHIIEAKIVNFKGLEKETFLLISIATDHDVLTNKYSESRIDLYIFEKEGKELTHFHSTRMDGLTTASVGFKGKVLLGVNGFLRTYQLGKKQLLKKGEYKHQYGLITEIKISNDRIYLGDSRNSVHLLRYKDGEFTELADDVLPRYLTGFDLVDHHTISLIDKYGNLSVLRIPPDSEQELSEDFMTYKFKWENGYLNGAPVKFDQLCSFYYQTLQTSIQKVTFTSSQEDVLLLGDIQGTIRLLIPFEFKAELDFFKHLELYLRLPQDGYSFLTDRDHLLFRSYHSSCRGVIDGDLCERFIDLNETNQELIAQNLDRTK